MNDPIEGRLDQVEIFKSYHSIEMIIYDVSYLVMWLVYILHTKKPISVEATLVKLIIDVYN